MSLNISILTVSDSRTEATDKSGAYLAEALTAVGHQLHEKVICADDKYLIRALVAAWIADHGVDVVILTGGTGFTGRDVSPEAILPLLDKEMTGFGELFRSLSFTELGTSAIQSRALAGVANATVVFCLPGSTGACRTAWQHIIEKQLGEQTRPCNLATLLPRFNET
jgi:molybdenum cofactor biosynthesis protein B